MSERPTNIYEKLVPSLINAVVVLVISLPFFLLWGHGLKWKMAVIAIFFVYNLGFAIFNKNRCLGMIIAKTSWQKEFNLIQKLVYTVLYTLSFSTIFFWIVFPFDLLLVNLLILQLPLVLLRQTTLHAFLSGKNKTVRSQQPKNQRGA